MKTLDKPRAVVIGSGFGGLACAVRLQASGFNVEILEMRDQPGGRAYVYKQDGFIFDGGPTVITAPHCLEELFECAGRRMSDYVELMPIDPFYRIFWENGDSFDYTNNLDRLKQQIQSMSPADWEGYQKFAAYADEVFKEGYENLAHVPFLSFWDMIRVSPQLMRLRADQSVYSRVSNFIKNPRLREVFSFHSLLVGGNPFKTSSIYTLINALERKWGVFFPKGGTGALVDGLLRLFFELGGKLHLNTKVVDIHCNKGSASEVIALTPDGKKNWNIDLVVSNADVAHTYSKLLGSTQYGQRRGQKLKKQRWSMSLFLIYFGTSQKYPSLAHHNVIFGPRYKGLLDDIFGHGVLAKDFSLYLHAPSLSDPSLAPEGHEAFYVLSPVPHMAKANLDWEIIGPKYANEILSYLEERYLPDLQKHIVTQKIFTPLDFSTELLATHGSAFSLEPILTQSAYFRVPNRDPKINNIYFVGAGTHPGAGVPGVVNSAKATSDLILKDFSAKDFKPSPKPQTPAFRSSVPGSSVPGSKTEEAML